MKNRSFHRKHWKLAPYALTEDNSKGRLFKEESSPQNQESDFQKDLNRILYSKAFQRLNSKTQVILADQFRKNTNRQTHSLKVAQFSELIAAHFGLNLIAVNAMAIGHDLGHPPFGHCGERTLNKILKDHNMDGFKHNFQSLLTVNKLEQGYQENSGLNLMYETRDAILKHTGIGGIANLEYYDSEMSVTPEYPLTLEGQIVSMGDEIAQRIHDTEDGMLTERIDIRDLLKQKIIQNCLRYENLDTNENLQGFKRNKAKFISIVIGALTRYYVFKTFESVRKNLEKHNIRRYEDLFKQKNPLIYWDKNFAKDDQDFQKDFLYPRFYHHSEIRSMESKAVLLLKRIFKAFKNQPNKLPKSIFKKFKSEMRSSIQNEFEKAEDSFKKDLKLFLDGGIQKCNGFCAYVPNSGKGSNRQEICPLKKHQRSACEGIRVIINYIAGMTENYAETKYRGMHSV